MNNRFLSHAARIGRNRRASLMIGLGLTVVAILFIQQALAQSVSPALKPPYHLNRSQLSTSSVILPNPALAGPIVVSETFGSSYAPTTTLSATGWHQVTGTLATSGYTWGRVISGTHPDSAWAAATSLNGDPILDPATDSYTNGMESLLIYGPLDLTNDGAAAMTATYFLDSQPGDYFGVAVSTDGANFNALSTDSSVDASLSVTHTAIYNLQAYAQKSNVWVAFYFTSNTDSNVGRGAFVDDVVIRVTPLTKIYLPILAHQYPLTPTPTPTPSPTPVTALYNYTFGSGLITDPDFLTWGGSYADTSCGTDCTRYAQGVTTSGNPGGAMSLYLTTLNDVAGASPNVTAPSDFEYSADIYAVQGKTAARYGLIFGASLATFGRDVDGFPTFDPNRNFYKFDLQFSDTDNTVVGYYRLQKCQNDFNNCSLIVDKTAVPLGLVHNVGSWNNITVDRLGNGLSVKVNGTQLFNITDTTFTGSRKFGVFVQSKDLNSAANPLKIRFDNIIIKALP